MYLGIATVALTVLVCLVERRVARPRMLLLAFSLYILWQLTTYFWSLQGDWTLETMQTMAQLLGMTWLVFELCPSERERLAVMQAFVFGCWVVCFVLISAFLSGQAMDGYRYAPEDFSLNGAADTLAMGIAMALIACTHLKKRALFWSNVAYIPIAVFSVVLTASRSGFAATCLACLGAFFVLHRKRPLVRFAWVVLILGTCLGLFLAMAGNQRLGSNVDRLLFTTETYSVATLSGRTDIWAAGADAFVEHPFVGVGLSTFPLAVEKQLGSPLVPHNLFIQVVVESGLVGLLLLGAVLASAFVPAVRRRSDMGLNLVLFGVTILMAFVANVQTNKAFWLALILLALTPRAVSASEDSMFHEAVVGSESGGQRGTAWA